MEGREKSIYIVTLTGTAVNALLIIIKFAAGILGRSQAMIADAIHSMSDFITDLIVLVFVKIASKPRDKDHDYGHGKYETLATLIIGILLILAGAGMVVSGIENVINSIKGNELERPGYIALIIAVISIISKEWLYRYTLNKGNKLNSQAVTANAYHHRSDAISSLGTLFGIAGAIFLGTSWRILDPLAAIVVSVFIIKSGYDIVKPCLSELLEASLPVETEKKILTTVLSIQGIKKVHNLRTRRIGNEIAIDLHAKMDGDITLTEAHNLATEAEEALRKLFGGAAIVNIHMEPF